MSSNDTRAIARLALPILKSLKAAELAYEEEVTEWYSRGEGRAPKWIEETNEDGETRMVNVGGRGYTFPHCIHGMSRWTDYDNICGGCESGESVYEIAIHEAGYAFRTFQQRMSITADFEKSARRAGDIPSELRRELMNWACEPIDRITKRY